MGCIGMSGDDFDGCTPSEYRAIYDRWRDSVELGRRTQWETARMVSLSVLQPWSTRTLRAQDIVEFPWETSTSEPPSTVGNSSDEDLKERYRAAKERLGLT